MDLYVVKDGEKLRCGYTTGSCAAAASKASIYMLENQEIIDFIEIDTPAGIRLKLEVNDQEFSDTTATCSIIKDGGDDPDVTDGMKIFSKVIKREDSEILIDGGIGIGRVTERSAFGNLGDAAINKVPLQMIEREIRSISENGYDVLIYAPMGVEIGKKTYNKNIGIDGGISIIGTKGIVYPMSEDALIKTIYMEMDNIKKNEGLSEILLVPGNYGENVAREEKIDIPMVKTSNYIGDSLSYAYREGFLKITVLGHIGKLAKLSIGIFNTHNKIADSRLEAFVYYLAIMKAPYNVIEEVMKTLTAEDALEVCIKYKYASIVSEMEKGAEYRIKRYLKDDNIDIQVRIYSMKRGLDIC